MQTTAIIEAALNVKARGITTIPEIMVPLVGTVNEFKEQEKVIRDYGRKNIQKKKGAYRLL